MRTRDLRANARKAGREAGASAAGWCSMTSQKEASRILKGIEDGDPMILDSFRTPNLSGEFSGDPTPRSLMEELGLDPDDPRAEWLESELCDKWQEAADSAFWRDLEKYCRESLR